MSGHNKWSTIKHKKAAADAKRGKVFSRLSKEITVAAKAGGGDPDMNPRLRNAVNAAKAVNMPNDNIDRAIKKGTGELPGVTYEEIVYEGYGPAGVGLIIEVLTDNRNRAASEVRSTLDKRGGSLAGSGAVSWQFSRKGYITVDKKATDEDTLFLTVTDAGAEDMETSGDIFEITTPYEEFEPVRKALEDAAITTATAELTMLPASSVSITSEKDASALLRLIDALEELDDVQNVYANFDMEDALMEKVAAE
jgi:YebC/PmpR family DNA-binding regulatory protein